MADFKKTLFCILLIAPIGLFAQSKFSYSVLVNRSASVDDEFSICIFRTTGGECLSMERHWKTNVTLAANYQVSKRIRIQSGLGYNSLSLDKVNEALGRDAYRINHYGLKVP